ncbi:MFS transporter [Thioclava sp. GXIMD4215]|uniref:MFS transporter n=1 Tax=Thioclava sp. GXIMD4215 TaxID=3131928 RepID=UPI00324DFE86
MPSQFSRSLFRRLVDDPDRDGGLKPAPREAEPSNFLRHIVGLAGTKSADGLIDPKLVLSWLLGHLGAGAFYTGLLVPVREAGALLPQIFTAALIHGRGRRKWVWALGSAVQGLAAGGIALAGLRLEGAVAGAVIVALLAVLAVARSACSVAYKDVLGKTIGQSRRGTVTGTASTIGSAAVVIFALVLLFVPVDRYALVEWAIFLASIGWGIGAVMMALMVEDDDGGTGESGLPNPWTLMREDRQLRLFIMARALLVGTALAPPYLVLLASKGSQDFAELGGLVLASSVAAFLSAYIWGRLSDRSSRRVLIYAGLAAALSLALALGMNAMGLAQTIWAMPVVLFCLMLAYHGVRQGRSTHLVDMSGPGERADYTAVSNTVVGIFLLVAGAGAAALGSVSVPLVIGVFLVMSVAGAWIATKLTEVQT